MSRFVRSWTAAYLISLIHAMCVLSPSSSWASARHWIHPVALMCWLINRPSAVLLAVATAFLALEEHTGQGVGVMSISLSVLIVPTMVFITSS